MIDVTGQAGVVVEKVDDRWLVSVIEDHAKTEQEFQTEEQAQDFAHTQRLRLGMIPQQDLA